MVVLEAREEVLPVFIGADQAQSIEQARQNIPSERPLTHDLLVEMVTDIGGAIDKVRIDDLAANTFYAKVDAELIRGGNAIGSSSMLDPVTGSRWQPASSVR